MGSWLVQEQDSCPGEERAGHGEPLAFAAAQERTRGTYAAIEATGEPGYHSGKPDGAQGLVHVRFGRLAAGRAGEQQIAANRGVEEVGLLGTPSGPPADAGPPG